MGGNDGFARRWLIHWITAMLFSVTFFIFLKAIEPPFLLRALDRAGSDAVIRAYSPKISELDQRIVVVDLGGGATTEVIARTLKSVARAHPKAVGLDLIVVPDLPDDPSASGASPIGVLADALKDPGWQRPRIAMPVSNEMLKKAIWDVKEIHKASVDLRRDEDGAVRSMCPKESSRTRLPTLAEAMLGRSETKCGPDYDPAILFAPVSVPQADNEPGVYIVTRETVASQPEILDDSYVLLGTASPGVGSDRFPTPVGELPGVMIHAQSLWTLTGGGANSWIQWEQHREFLASLLDLLTAFVAGAVFSLYVAWRDRREQRISSISQALWRFAEGLVVLGCVAGVLIIFGVAWTWLAVGLLSAGVVIGAMSATFGAMLETLVHAGELLVHPLHWLVERLMERKTVKVVALAIIRFRSPAALSDRADDEA